MHPTDVAEAILAGAVGSFADAKYGWPHKAYFKNVPNPHAGMTEVRSYSSSESDGYESVTSPRYDTMTGERIADHVEWVKKSIAPQVTVGKFYTIHLLDATPEERGVIEKHLGVKFIFRNGQVEWERHSG
jgi:hypothetical protein